MESIINGRPITTVSGDCNDPEPLTQNHLLLLSSEPQMPPWVIPKGRLLLPKQMKTSAITHISFGSDGLRSTCLCSKADRNGRRFARIWPLGILFYLAVGDIVLVSAENSSRNSWPLDRVVEVFADKKGLVRRTRLIEA